MGGSLSCRGAAPLDCAAVMDSALVNLTGAALASASCGEADDVTFKALTDEETGAIAPAWGDADPMAFAGGANTLHACCQGRWEAGLAMPADMCKCTPYSYTWLIGVGFSIFSSAATTFGLILMKCAQNQNDTPPPDKKRKVLMAR